MSEPAVVIGAGVNELVAAHALAQAGRRVLVLDEGPGADASLQASWVPPDIVRKLSLEQHGLRMERLDPWIAAPLDGAGRLELWHDMARSVEAIRRLSARDAELWPAFCDRMAQAARLLEVLYAAPPPDPLGRKPRDLAQLLGIALRAHRLGRQAIEDVLRLLPMPVADLLDDWFESDALKGVLGAAAVRDLPRGPRAGGTALALLHRHVGSPPGVFAPPQSNASSVLRAMPGLEIRAGHATRIQLRAGRVAGVELSSGETIAASLVVSGADPRRTLLALLEPGLLDPELARAVRHIRCRGAAARIALELDRAPGFEKLLLAPSLDYLERASDDAKYGQVSRQPYLEARSAGADGRHRLELRLQYAPRAPSEVEWEGAVQTLLAHVPGLRGAIVSRAVVPPEQAQAELALDQFLWMRPVPELARYRTPVRGLYLCGPAMHPGAGVAGASGYLCARRILARR